jgi:hypothetical protein
MTSHDEKSIYDLYETDMSKEVDGFWYPVNKSISIKMARAGGANMAFTKAMEQKTRSHRKRGGAFEGDNVDVELANELMREAFAETIILDWKGVTNKEGKKIAYSPAAAVKLLTDLPDLFIDLREAAGSAANFRAEGIKEDVGN